MLAKHERDCRFDQAALEYLAVEKQIDGDPRSEFEGSRADRVKGALEVSNP